MSVKVLNESEISKSNDCKNQIRCLISNVYDLQKLRIAAGNRLVMSFYIQMGIEPSESPDSAEKEEKKMIDTLKKEYKRITDGVADSNVTIKRKIKELNEGDDALRYIRNEIDYKLIQSYMLLLQSEEEAVKVLDKYVKAHPLFPAFFENIKGCGTLMSAVCIAYLDIRKARYVSSFYRYCGLDTVQDEDKDGNKLFLTKDGRPRKVRQKMGYLKDSGEHYFGAVKATSDFDAEGNQIFLTEDGEQVFKFYITKLVDSIEVPVYEDIETLEEYVGDVVFSEHGRRMGDTEMVEYIDKNGEVQLKRGITYNPVIKTKLMGVLTGCLLKAKDPTYSTIYYDYRKRLDSSAYHKNHSDGRKNMMAQRYMIKQFLRNLWTTWRELEGLEVNYPYEVEKLGHKPHKYNQYQCDTADKYRSTL